LAGSNGVGSD